MSLFFAIDISSSMDGPKLVAARNFAVKLIDDLNATGHLVEAGAFEFCSRAVLFQPFQNPNTLRTSLSGLNFTCINNPLDGTALFDAIVDGSVQIKARPTSNFKLFVVITDGDDTGSVNTAFDAATALSSGNIRTRLVFIGSGSSPTLNGIASAAGGPPKVKAVAATAANLNSLVNEIVDTTCTNFRPTAAMNISDLDFHLGVEGFQMDFDGSPSSDETPDTGLTFNWVITRPNGTKINRSGMKISEMMDDNQLPQETWTVSLIVKDAQGFTATSTRTFRVIGSPPDINVAGTKTIDVLQNIRVRADPGLDTDGGPLVYVWDIVESPPASSHPPQTNYYTGREPPQITTTESDIGRWKFKATATDDEGDTDTGEIIVEVKNLPPEIDLEGDHNIAAGEPLRVKTKIINDVDGGLLSFAWDIIQAPQSAPIPVQLTFHAGTGLDGSSLEIPTTASHAGTWIVKLRAIDNDDSPNSQTSEYFTVVVDGPPTATITGPTEIGSLSFPLELSGESSVDADSPCPTQPHRCHNTLEPPVREISHDFKSYRWSLIDVPFELLDKYQPGQIDESLGRDAHKSTMSLNFGDIEPGEWTFQLDVTDAEDNVDSTTFKVTVADLNGRPTAVANGPARYVVSVTGQISQNIVLNGGQSFDLDNLLGPDPFGPGAGITNYQWNVVEAPTGCTAPVIPPGPNQNLFAAGSVVQTGCQGFWRVQLTVTDDDNPAKTDKADTSVLIGNCPQALCIDYPTHFEPQFIEFVEGTDIIVFYHLDSTLYDNPGLQSGMFTSLEIFHESDLVTPVYTSIDPNVLASNKGGYLKFHWNGYSNTNERPLSGRYTLRISAIDANLINVPGTSMTEEQAIWIAVAEPKILPASDRYENFDALDTGTSQLEIDYEVQGTTTPDQLRWRVINTSNNIVFETTTSAAAAGTISWNGQIGSSTIPPGSYKFELEAFRGGKSLGLSSQHPFVVYKLGMPICGNLSTASTTGIFLARNPTPVNVANFEMLKFTMQRLPISVEGADATTEVKLEYETGSPSIAEIRDSGLLHSAIPLPKTWTASDFAAGRLEIPLLANGVGSGEATLKLSYRAGGSELAVKRVKIRVGDLPGLAGTRTTDYPSFLYGRVVNEGSPVTTAVDPSRFTERIDRRAMIYLVNHKSAASWATDPTLVPVVPPIVTTIAAGSVSANATTFAGVPPGKYDIVYDFGTCPSNGATFTTDARLNVGDLIDTIVPDQPSVVVVPSTVTPGQNGTTTEEYGMVGPPKTVSVPAGYDGLAAPFNFRLRGRLIFPSAIPAGTNVPLVVIAHGNHIPQHVNLGPGFFAVDPNLTADENFRGHTYLQKHLASRGYATLSVDLDEMYGDASVGYPPIPGAGIRLRAYVLLRNIEEVISNATIAGGALSGKIDQNRIYLVGHSRGGEATLVARSLLEGSTPSPPLATPYTLPASSIKGMISISPISAVNAPMGTPPFLLIYGSADGDVNGATNPGVWPFRHFDRSNGPAHQIYAIGANHNYFNSSWPFSDASEDVMCATHSSCSIVRLGIPVGPRASLLDRIPQEQLAIAYTTAFLMLYDKGMSEYEAYFSTPPSLLRPAGLDPNIPLTGVTRRATGATRVVLDSYESNSGLTLTSSGLTVSSTVAGLSEDVLADFDLSDETDAANRFFQETRGGLFGWAAASNYKVTLTGPLQDLRNSTIALRLAQQPNHALTPAGPVDFAITLEDAAGKTSTVRASAWLMAQDIYVSEVASVDTTKAVFETFVFPWWAFVADGRPLDLSRIVSMRVDLATPGTSPQGRVAIDDLEIWR